MPIVQTSLSNLNSLARIDSLAVFEASELQYGVAIEEASAAISDGVDFTALSAALIEAEAGDYTLQLTGSGLDPVSSAQELEDAINNSLITGSFDTLTLFDDTTEILAFQVLPSGYQISSGDLTLDLLGVLPSTFEDLFDLVGDLDLLLGDLSNLTNADRNGVIDRLSGTAATGLRLREDGETVASIELTGDALEINFVDYRVVLENDIDPDLGALAGLLFDLERLGDQPGIAAVEALVDFGGFSITDPDDNLLAFMTEDNLEELIDTGGSVVFDVDGFLFDYLYIDAAPGSEGYDTFDFAPDGRSLMLGFAGDDTLVGGDGVNVINGGNGDDLLQGGFLALNDISGSGGEDLIYGGDGDDILRGGRQSDFIEGGFGDDTIRGQRDADTLYGNYGDDNIKGGGGRDMLDGGFDDDFLKGGTRQDTIIGGDGDDTLIGNSFNDLLDGGAGHDVLNGGGDNDWLIGGEGDDTMKGGGGADRFEFEQFGAPGSDVIQDFDVGEDILAIRGFQNPDFPQGVEDAARVVEGGVAVTIWDGVDVFFAGLTTTTGLADAIEFV